MQHWYMYRYVSVCESGMIPVQTHALLLLLLLSAWCRNVPPGPSFGRRQGTVVSLVGHAAEANASHDQTLLQFLEDRNPDQMIDAPCDPQDAVRIPDPNQLPLDCASVRQILNHIKRNLSEPTIGSGADHDVYEAQWDSRQLSLDPWNEFGFGACVAENAHTGCYEHTNLEACRADTDVNGVQCLWHYHVVVKMPRKAGRDEAQWQCYQKQLREVLLCSS